MTAPLTGPVANRELAARKGLAVNKGPVGHNRLVALAAAEEEALDS